MSTYLMPMPCQKCKWFVQGNGVVNGRWSCKAFPNGIPDEVYDNRKHKKPLPDQKNDIVFEPIEADEK